MSDSFDGNAVSEIAALERKSEAGTIVSIGEGIDAQVVYNADGGITLKSIKPLLDEYAERPERLKGELVALTESAFVELFNRHKDGDSATFADLTNLAAPKLVAVLDYHEERAEALSTPRYGAHRLSYGYPISDEAKAWQAAHGKELSQLLFAAFIEDRIADLVAPTEAESADFKRLFQTVPATPADVITVSRGLEITVEGKLTESHVLATGETEFNFTEVHKDGSGKKLRVPSLFMISIPLFIADSEVEKVRLAVRLRYRKSEGGVKWFYQIYRWEHSVRSFLLDSLDRIREQTGAPVYEGKPEPVLG